MSKAALTSQEIMRLFDLLHAQLAERGVRAELYLVGGAVMCLSLNARVSTMDVDCLFQPSRVVRECAAAVALEAGVSEHWLNDGVKGYLSAHGTFTPYIDMEFLHVYMAQPDYIFAMKCLAMRLGEEFYDLDDVRFLIRNLNIESYDSACEVLAKFYPIERFPQKTLYVLQELLG